MGIYNRSFFSWCAWQTTGFAGIPVYPFLLHTIPDEACLEPRTMVQTPSNVQSMECRTFGMTIEESWVRSSMALWLQILPVDAVNYDHLWFTCLALKAIWFQDLDILDQTTWEPIPHVRWFLHHFEGCSSSLHLVAPRLRQPAGKKARIRTCESFFRALPRRHFLWIFHVFVFVNESQSPDVDTTFTKYLGTLSYYQL